MLINRVCLFVATLSSVFMAYGAAPQRVRCTIADELCGAEQQYVSQRVPIAQNALQAFLETHVTKQQAPTIAVCFSGGGMRAMTTTCGFLMGCDDIGLLDCCRYVSGLSGSTWSIAPWIASSLSINDYYEMLCERFVNGLESLVTDEVVEELAQLCSQALLSGYKITPLDVYAVVLGHLFLNPYCAHNTTLSETHKHVANGTVPMPIYSALEVSRAQYAWMEWTPFEVGIPACHSYIPMSAFGRTFNHGLSLDDAAELPLSRCLGIFGSVFAVNLKDVLHQELISLISKTKLNAVMKTLVIQLVKLAFDHVNEFALKRPCKKRLGNIRLFPVYVPNFCHGLANNVYAQQDVLSCADAGADFNMALPPLLRPARQVDVIIMYDASGDIKGAPTLVAAEYYARAHGHPFPHIDYTDVDKKPVSVFMDDDPRTPVVIYFPLIANKNYSSSFDPAQCIKHDYCGTMNFNYTVAQLDELSGLARYTVKQNAHVIKQAICNKIGISV